MSNIFGSPTGGGKIIRDRCDPECDGPFCVCGKSHLSGSNPYQQVSNVAPFANMITCGVGLTCYVFIWTIIRLGELICR